MTNVKTSTTIMLSASVIITIILAGITHNSITSVLHLRSNELERTLQQMTPTEKFIYTVSQKHPRHF